MNTESAVESVAEVAVESVAEVAVESVAEVATSEEPTVVVHANVASAIEGVKVKGKPGRKVVPGSGLQRAKEIFARMAGAARSDVVAAFVADKIPKASANTYYHLIKNQSNPS